MFGKRFTSEVRGRGPRSQYRPKLVTDNVSWNSWLVTVSNFFGKGQSCPNVTPLFVEKYSDNRPYITVSLFEKQITALLDSGASHSVIGGPGLRLIDEFCLEIDRCHEKEIATADGGRQSISGCVYLPLCVDGITRSLKLLVVPSISNLLILGSDFARLFMLVMDYPSWSYRIRKEGTHNSVSFPSLSALEAMSPAVRGPEDLSAAQATQLQEISAKFAQLPWKSGTKLGRTNKIFHRIDTGDALPMKQRQYPCPPICFNTCIGKSRLWCLWE